MLQNQIRLEELLGRDVAVLWYEGIALVQAVCRHQLARGGSSELFPTASEILLALDGTVATLPPSGRNAVTTAARILARMLSDDVPVRLRLIVTQATGAEAAYPTLLEFSNALAYFERPDGVQVLQRLAERAAVAPVRDSLPADDPASFALKHQTDPPAQAGSPLRRRFRPIAVAVVVIVCASAAWLVPSTSGYGRLSSALDALKAIIPSKAAEAPASATAGPDGNGGASSAVRRRWAAKPAVGSTQEPAGREQAARPVQAQVLSPLPSRLPLNALRGFPTWKPPEWRPVFNETVEITASADSDEGDVAPDGERIYSGADAGVIPPRSVYPRLPTDPQPGRRREDQTVLELVIATNGLVERANLRTPPRDIHEFMLVSAAKAWLFEPATIGGQPVRFRHRLLISLP